MRRVTLLSCFRLALLSIFTLPSLVWGQEQIAPPPSTAITGVYDGNYRCARGPVNLQLTLVAPGDGSLMGVFTLDLPANSRSRTASYTLRGMYDAATGRFRLVPVKWESPAPPGFVMVGMDGAFNSSAEQVSGKITYPACTTFEATRNKAQSAALANRPAVTPGAPAARSAPANANQAPASAAAHPAPPAPAADGTAQTTSAPQGQDSAQTNIPPSSAQSSGANKKACDFITKSDAESILGQPVEAGGNNTFLCSFIETGRANKVPPFKQVDLSVRYGAFPDNYAVAWKNISDHQLPTEVVTEVPNFSDAAIWRWIPPGWGRLIAFKGGTIEVVVTISGVPEDSAFQNAKTLAARPLGGTAGTGYVYPQPLPKTVAPAVLPPRKALVAGLEPPLKNVALSVCNAGKVDIDVFVAAVDTHVVTSYDGPKEHPIQSVRIYDVAKDGPIVSSHIVPSACARVYSENVGVPAYVGLALVDSRGQWGTARRLDLLPDFGIDVLTKADKSVSILRADKEVAAKMQLLFRPRNPTCSQTNTYSARARLPLNATAAQRAAAAIEDANRPPSETACETLGYVLNVLAYPESREITFNKFCDPCQKKVEARITPEERAAGQQRSDATNQEIGKLRATGPLGALIMGKVVNQAKQQGQEEEREREQERRRQQPESYQRMNWNEMNLALKYVRTGGGRPPEMPQYLIIRGTVSRVDVSPPGASEHWVNVYFRESPEQASTAFETLYGAFNVCTSDAGIFEDMFGPDFRSRMIGQVLEVEGAYQRSYCKGWKGSIRVTLARQLRSVGAAVPTAPMGNVR